MADAFGAVLPPEGLNAIWEALGAEARRVFGGNVSEVKLEAQRLLSAEEEGGDGLYFPLSCVICRIVSLPEGTSVKVSVVGREGVVGSPALVGSSVSAFRTVVQLPGRALFISKGEAQRLFDLPGVARILFRYALLLLRESSLTAACNRSHPTKQRLARWLLLIRDRANGDEFPLTHESLSAMLGVRRESVTLSAKELRNVGAIDYRRATVTVTSRAELEEQACSCYETITGGYARFLEAELRRPS
jgi:CRP-like cAMP-binding protein